MSEQKRMITPEEFAEYARENNATVIVVAPNDPQPNAYDPQPKGRAERLAMSASAFLLPIAKQYAATLEYLIRKDILDGDSEGAALKRFTLATVNAAIAQAEGSTNPPIS